MKKLIFALIAIMLPNLSNADLSPDVFKKLSGSKKSDKTMVEMYVGGVVKGYLQSNAFLASSNQIQLFCYSGDIDTSTAHQIATLAVSEHLAKSPQDSKLEIVEMLILLKLKNLYPC